MDEKQMIFFESRKIDSRNDSRWMKNEAQIGLKILINNKKTLLISKQVQNIE